MSSNKISFNDLVHLFVKKTSHTEVLKAEYGKGSVQTFHLAKGLQARFWDCTFNRELEIQGLAGVETESSYFTLAFFLHTEGVALSNDYVVSNQAFWDTVFLSIRSAYRLHISP